MDIVTRPDLLSLLAPPETPRPNLLQATDKNADKNAGLQKGAEEARAAAQKFEAFFLRTVLEDIIPEPRQDALGGGGHAEQIWGSLLHEQYAELLAERGGFGIADLVYQQLMSLQENQQATQETLQKTLQETLRETQKSARKVTREDTHDDNFQAIREQAR